VFTAAAAVTRSVREAFDAIEGGKGGQVTPKGIINPETFNNAIKNGIKPFKKETKSIGELLPQVEKSAVDLGAVIQSTLTSAFSSLGEVFRVAYLRETQVQKISLRLYLVLWLIFLAL